MRKKSRTMTAEMVKIAKAMLESGQYYQHQIAAFLGVNQGRISEVKNGRYGV